MPNYNISFQTILQPTVFATAQPYNECVHLTWSLQVRIYKLKYVYLLSFASDQLFVVSYALILVCYDCIIMLSSNRQLDLYQPCVTCQIADCLSWTNIAVTLTRICVGTIFQSILTSGRSIATNTEILE